MKRIAALVALAILFGVGDSALSDSARVVQMNRDNLFVVEVSVTGKRGTLSFPALIDTGASHSMIPRSVADGIGYSSERNAQYRTASGTESFTVIRVRELQFLDMKFQNLEVAISEPNNLFKIKPFKVPNPYGSDNVHEEPEEELAVIGMSELSKVKFVQDKGTITFSPGQHSVIR